MNVRPGVHWQLLAFAYIALLHGGGMGLRLSLQTQGALPPGIQALAVPVLLLEIAGWTCAGVFALLCAVVLRRWHFHARATIGIMCGAWAGLYVYSWLWQARPYDWFPAAFYLGIAAAVLAKPLWQVTIRGGPR